MKKLLFLFFALYLLSFQSKAQIVISGYMANPASTDSAYEYAQFMATQDIDFSVTPYSVVFLNNGNVGPKGWVHGSNVTYSFYLNSGTVNKGDVFYVGGSEKRIAGSNSTDISSEKWIKTISTYNTTGDGFGSSAINGVLGNGGAGADGIGVFSGEITQNDSFLYPIDCIFFGDAIGGASVSGRGYLVNKNNDHYDPQYGYFGEIINTFLFPSATSNMMIRLKGAFNTSTQTWDTARVADTLTLKLNSTISNIESKITLNTIPAVFNVNLNGFTSDYGNGYLNEGLAKVFTLNGNYLLDSISLKVNAPFEIRSSTGNYTSDTLKLSPNIGSEDVFVQFNPTVLGAFQDTLYIKTAGQNTIKVMVKGNAIVRPEIGFAESKKTVIEDADTQIFSIKIKNHNSNSTFAKLVILDTFNTAKRGKDFHFYINGNMNDTLNEFTFFFPANSSNDFTFKIKTIDNKLPQEKRSAKFMIIDQGNGALLDIDTFEMIIEDDDYRQVEICPLRNQNVFGVADSIGRLYEIKGIVYGKNELTTGYQFTLINGNCGINIYNPSGFPFYNVRQGDSVLLRGRLAQVNGLTQMQDIDTLYVITVFTTLKTPTNITKPNEGNESNLVRINDVYLKDTATGSTWGLGEYKAYIKNTPDTFMIRISQPNHELLGKIKPVNKFHLIGIVGQDDTLSAYLHNYYISPRDTSDVINIYDTLSAFNLVSPADFYEDTMKGLLSETLDFIWEQSNTAPNLGLNSPTYQLAFDEVGADFSVPLFSTFSSNSGFANSISLPFNSIINFLNSQGVIVGQTQSYEWNVIAQIGNYKRLANAARVITFYRGAMNGINNILLATQVNAYPNPANEQIMISCSEKIAKIELFDMQGKLIKTLENILDKNVKINLEELNSGTYIAKITSTENNIGTVKFVK